MNRCISTALASASFSAASNLYFRQWVPHDCDETPACTPLAKNDSVLTAGATQNIWDMANNPIKFIKDNLSFPVNVHSANGGNFDIQQSMAMTTMMPNPHKSKPSKPNATTIVWPSLDSSPSGFLPWFCSWPTKLFGKSDPKCKRVEKKTTFAPVYGLWPIAYGRWQL